MWALPERIMLPEMASVIAGARKSVPRRIPPAGSCGWFMYSRWRQLLEVLTGWFRSRLANC